MKFEKFLLIMFFCCFQNSKSQNILKNSAFLEVFGHSGAIISVNYERLFPLNEHLIISARTGIGMNSGSDNESSYYYPSQTTIPIVGTFLAGIGNHYIQLSSSYTSIFSEDYITPNSNDIYKKYDRFYEVSIGYRYMQIRMNENIGINAQIYPTFEVFKKSQTLKDGVGFGVSFGVTF